MDIGITPEPRENLFVRVIPRIDESVRYLLLLIVMPRRHPYVYSIDDLFQHTVMGS